MTASGPVHPAAIRADVVSTGDRERFNLTTLKLAGVANTKTKHSSYPRTPVSCFVLVETSKAARLLFSQSRPKPPPGFCHGVRTVCTLEASVPGDTSLGNGALETWQRQDT